MSLERDMMKEIKRLVAENNMLREKYTISKEINIKKQNDLEEELVAAQAVIEQMREAIESALDQIHYWSQGRVDVFALTKISEAFSLPANLRLAANRRRR